jgi:hypothetical protein
MILRTSVCLSAIFIAAFAAAAGADENSPSLPTTYEVLINGESFRVELNRAVKVQSAAKPGTTYQLALRVAPTQVLRLNTVQLEYDMPAKVFDEGGGRRQHTVRIKHELGFSIMLTDVGEVLDKDEQDKALERLKGSVVATYHDVKGATLAVGNPHLLNFSNAYGSGITIHYTVHEGDRDFGHTCQACVLSGPTFTVTCLIQYLDTDKKDVMPLITKTLKSIRALP